MRIERTGGPGLSGWIIAMVLVAGVLIGLLLDRHQLQSLLVTARNGRTQALPSGFAHSPTGEIPTIEIKISPEGMKMLAHARADSIARGQIMHAHESTVDAVVAHGKDVFPAKVRIKGDWIDHVETDKVSLRIAMNGGTILGMSEFSIQHPKTRGYLAEWLVLETARKVGLLSPRCEYVSVRLNGGDNGVYFLEEHFTKEMLESQQRREGPIMRFDEDALWSYRADSKAAQAGDMLAEKDFTAATSAISAYGNADGPLAKQYDEAFRAMKQLQMVISQWRSSGTVGNGNIAECLDIRQTAKAEALMRVFNTWHGLVWHNLRFYFNAVTARLEPVIFDSGAREGGLTFDGGAAVVAAYPEYTLGAMLMTNPLYATAYHEALAQFSDPAFLVEIETEFRPRLTALASVLAAERLLPESDTPEALLNSLRTDAQRIKETISPTMPALFSCVAHAASGTDNEAEIAEVEAWSATRIPAVLMGFRFSNGRFVPASQTIEASEAGVIHREDGSVVLPTDGSRKVFRLPLDNRLSGLIEVKQVKAAAKAGSEMMPKADVQAYAVCRPVTRKDVTEIPLDIRHHDSAWDTQGGRPAAVTVEQALHAHPFLSFNQTNRTLEAARGTWNVSGDLVVPEGVRLVLGPGVTLKFDPKALLFSTSSVQFVGRFDEPVVLEPRVNGTQWSGITVLEAASPSQMKYTRLVGTMRPSRGGWQHTGAVNFFRSDLALEDCRFEDSHAEDALNVIRASIRFERCVFTGAKSDLFDGDFVTGTISDCEFSNSVGDGIDVSGSDVVVERCRFIAVNDKSLSVGERSRAKINSCVTESSGIGIAAKDGSTVEVYDYTLKHAKFFGLAAYVKKSEIGPATLVVTSSSVGECGQGQTICQTGSSMVVDGAPVQATDFDVDAMYRSEVLGSNPWGKQK